MNHLIEKLRCYIEFNEDEERFISSVFKLKHFAKGEHFLLAGDICCEAAFIESGVFRFYINTDEKGPVFIPKIQSALRRLCLDQPYSSLARAIHLPVRFARPSSSKHAPATSRPISYLWAINSGGSTLPNHSYAARK